MIRLRCSQNLGARSLTGDMVTKNEEQAELKVDVEVALREIVSPKNGRNKKEGELEISSR